MIDPNVPEEVREARRALWAELTPQHFAGWQHNLITAAFFQHLEDRYTASRELVADIVEGFAVGDAQANPLRDLGVLRGELGLLKVLRGIDLSVIQGFYGQEPAVDQAEDRQDE